MGVHISDLADSIWEQVRQSYAQNKNIVTLIDISPCLKSECLSAGAPSGI